MLPLFLYFVGTGAITKQAQILEAGIAQKRPRLFPYMTQDVTKVFNQQSHRNACDECNRSFISRQGLINHKKLSHGSKEDCFTCNFCDKIFPTRAQLTRHMKVHSNDRPYVCELCNKRYKHKQDLKFHMDSMKHWWFLMYWFTILIWLWRFAKWTELRQDLIFWCRFVITRASDR